MSVYGDAVLTQCPVCNHKVSSCAKQCPSCGHPLARQGFQKRKERLEGIAISFASNTKEIVNVASKATMAIFKFFLWFALTGVIGTITKLVCESMVDGGIVTWLIIVVAQPAFATIPTLALAKNIVGQTFARVISYVCSATCVVSAFGIFPAFCGTRYSQPECALLIFGTAVAFMWSVYFASHDNQSKIEKGIKRILIALNLVFACVIAVVTILHP